MKRYRLLLFDTCECLHAGHWFHARDDEQAHWIAEQLHDACSDVCASYVLRQGSREIAHREAAAALPQSVAEMSERRQQLLVFHEEVLLESAFHIEESRRLLDQLREVKGL